MKIITSAFLFLAMICSFTSFAQSSTVDSTETSNVSSQVEDPVEGLKAITELYRLKDSKTLITKRYSELPDMMNQEQLQKLQNILDKRFAKQAFVEQMVTILETAQKSTPNVVVNSRARHSETDQMAEFEIGSGQKLKLYLMKSGLWGFHM